MSNWQEQAACAGLTPAEADRIFFNEHPGRPNNTEAKAICRGCPVRESCRQAGRTEEYGIWGGVPAGFATAVA